MNNLFLFKYEKMGLGIWNKLGKFVDWDKDKAVNTAIPAIGKISDFINSNAVSSAVNWAAPVLNTIVPSLGTGISAALPMVQKFASSFNNQAQKFGSTLQNMNKPFSEQQPTRNIKQGIGLARRPDTIHPRLELKDGSGIEYNRNGSYAEVLE
jgi:hypothetical protein